MITRWCTKWMLLALAFPIVAAADDFWGLLDDDLSSSLSLTAGADVDGGSTYGLSSDLRLPGALRLQTSYRQTGIEDDRRSFDTRHWSVGLGTDPLAPWSGTAGYSQWGDAEAIETRDGFVQVTYSTGTWTWNAGIEAGQLELQVDAAVLGTDGIRRVRRLLERDRFGARVGLSWNGRNSYAHILHAQRRFNEDLSLPLNQRRVLILNTEVVEQALSLAEQTTRIGVGWYLGKWRSGVDLTRTVSALDNDDTNIFATLSLDRNVGQYLNIGLLIDTPLDDDLVQGELELSFFW